MSEAAAALREGAGTLAAHDGEGATELLDSLDAIAAIEPEWRRLAEARGNAFLTPEWYRAWLAYYEDQATPLVAVARGADGGVLGLLPLVESREGRVRSLRFAGWNLGDVFHPVATTRDEPTVARLAASALLAAPTAGPRVIVLDNAELAGSWSRQIVAASRQIVETNGRESVLPFIELDGRSASDYFATRSPNLQSQLNRKRASLERGRELRFRRTSGQELETDVATLFRLHDARWRARGGSSVSSPRARAFLGHFASQALAAGWLRLWLLEVSGEPIAAWYGWRLGTRYSYYTAGFDPRWAKHSVGLLLLARTIEDAADEQASVYDMLLGSEGYKLRFATGARMVRTSVLTPWLHPTRALALLDNGLRRAGALLPAGGRRRLRRAAGGALRFLPSARVR